LNRGARRLKRGLGTGGLRFLQGMKLLQRT